MHNNLTGAIAANVTLIQPGYNGTLALILAAFLGALVAGGIALIRDYKKSKTAEKQRKQQVYSQLMGTEIYLSNCLQQIYLMPLELSFIQLDTFWLMKKRISSAHTN